MYICVYIFICVEMFIFPHRVTSFVVFSSVHSLLASVLVGIISCFLHSEAYFPDPLTVDGIT